MRLPLIVDGGATCFSCPAPCCASYVVPLTGFDLWRLSRGLQLPWREVAEARVDGATWEGFRVAGSEQSWGLFLRTARGEACRFLLSLPGGGQRCGAHSSRPLACRVYPWQPSDSSQLGIDINPDAMCPSPQRAHFESQKLEARGAVNDELAERPLYKLAVLRWNQSAPGGADEFVAWLFALYDALAPLREPPRESDSWRRDAQRFIDAFPL